MPCVGKLKNCVCGTDSSTVNLYMSHRSYCSGVSVCVSMHALCVSTCVVRSMEV